MRTPLRTHLSKVASWVFHFVRDPFVVFSCDMHTQRVRLGENRTLHDESQINFNQNADRFLGTLVTDNTLLCHINDTFTRRKWEWMLFRLSMEGTRQLLFYSQGYDYC